MRLLIQDLQPSTAYQVQVRAVNTQTVSEWSRLFPVTTIADSTAPSAPTSFAWVTSGSSFVASWVRPTTNGDSSALLDFDHFELTLTASGIDKTISTTNTTYTLALAENIALWGTAKPSITAKVRAVDNTGNAGPYTTPIVATNAAPANPSSLVATAVNNGISLSWMAAADTDIVGYNVYIGAALIGSVTGTTFLYNSTTYTSQTLTVKTVDLFGQESAGVSASATPISPFGVDTTAPATPTGLAAAITTATTADLATVATVTWSANAESDLAGYKIRYRRTGDTNWTEETVSKDTTNYVVRNLTPYVNYDFQLRAFDWQANNSAFTATVTGTGATNAAPSTPTAPTVSSNTLQIQVTVPGTKAAGGAMESDVTSYEVYASTTTGFTPAAASMVGVIPVGPALIGTFNIPASGGTATQSWFVKIIAVDSGGLKSAASAQATANPNLIAATNIVDATITNAKIFDLSATKLTAGTINTGDITVKSKLVIGDAASTGAIESFGYVANTTGFRIDKSAFEVNQGTIKAAALVLQQGQNLVPPQFADFEWLASFYATGTFIAQGGMIRNGNANAKFGTQSLATLWSTNVSNPILYLGSSATDYNIRVDAGTAYIFSAYFWTSGAVATNIQFKVKWSTGAISTIQSTTPATGGSPATATRFTNVLTAPAGATGAVLLVESSTLTANAGWNMDGVQVEQQWTSATAPSSWTPPSRTTIDGGMIRTGSLVSTASSIYFDPALNGGLGGYTTDTAHPAWTINMAGNAEFYNVAVRGSMVVGTVSDPFAWSNTVASGNYVPGTTGWIARGDGYAEFRNMAVDSFHGNVIRAGTLRAEAISTGSLTADVSITSGAIRAGDPAIGQVILDSGGFTVIGTPPAGQSVGPDLIVFPTNGSPNIVSGQLEADTLIVKTGMTIRQASSIESGASLTIEGRIVPPKAGPTLSHQWDTQNLAPPTFATDGLPWSNGVCRDTSGNYYGFGYGYDSLINYRWYLWKWDSAGAWIGKTEITALAGQNYANVSMVIAPNNKMYIAQRKGTDYAADLGTNIYRVNFDGTIAQTFSFSNSNESILGMGVDHITSGLVIVHKQNFTSGIHFTKLVSLDPTTGNVTGFTSGPNLTLTSPRTFNFLGISRGNFDLGGERYIAKAEDGFYSYNSTGVFQTLESWPSVGAETMGETMNFTSWFWDTALSMFRQFIIIGETQPAMVSYAGGDSLVPSSNTARWYVNYSWYDSNATGGTHETVNGPTSNILATRRAKLKITINSIPVGGGGTDNPDSARVYVGQASTAANMFLRETIVAPSTVVVMDPFGSNGQASNAARTDFNVINPGQIVSSTGNSFWKGDDTAQFYQLVVNSGTDASTAAGNVPALRVGNTAGIHLRIDGNEIIAMNDDTTPGILRLNVGGSGIVIGSGTTLTKVRNGRVTGQTTNASGVITVNHSGVGTPDAVTIGPRSAHVMRLQAMGASSFEVEIRSAVGAGLVGSGVSVNLDWIAVWN